MAKTELELYAGILQWWNKVEKCITSFFFFSPTEKEKEKEKNSHDVRAIGCGDQDVEVEQDVQVAAEVGGAVHRLQASAQVHTRIQTHARTHTNKHTHKGEARQSKLKNSFSTQTGNHSQSAVSARRKQEFLTVS